MSTKLTAKRHKSLGISGLDMTVVSTRRRFQKLWVKSCFCCSLGLAAIPFAFTFSSTLCFAETIRKDAKLLLYSVYSVLSTLQYTGTHCFRFTWDKSKSNFENSIDARPFFERY